MSLTQDELEAMREHAEITMPDSAVIERPSWVSDGGGGGTASFLAVGTVPCRINPMVPPENAEVVAGNRLESNVRHVVSLPAGTEVRLTDRLSIGNVKYSVSAIRGPRSFEITRRVEVRLEN